MPRRGPGLARRRAPSGSFWLAGLAITALADALGRRAGVLLGRSGGHDIIDAAIAMLAADGDWMLTSDPHDVLALADAAGVVELVPV